jgi:hypothetical protein
MRGQGSLRLRQRASTKAASVGVGFGKSAQADSLSPPTSPLHAPMILHHTRTLTRWVALHLHKRRAVIAHACVGGGCPCLGRAAQSGAVQEAAARVAGAGIGLSNGWVANSRHCMQSASGPGDGQSSQPCSGSCRNLVWCTNLHARHVRTLCQTCGHQGEGAGFPPSHHHTGGQKFEF